MVTFMPRNYTFFLPVVQCRLQSFRLHLDRLRYGTAEPAQYSRTLALEKVTKKYKQQFIAFVSRERMLSHDLKEDRCPSGIREKADRNVENKKSVVHVLFLRLYPIKHHESVETLKDCT